MDKEHHIEVLSSSSLGSSSGTSEAEKESYVFKSATSLSTRTVPIARKPSIPDSTPSRRPSVVRQSSTDILQSNDKLFKASNQSKFWQHGFPLPHTVLKYKPISDSSKANTLSDSLARQNFDPMLSLEPVEYIQYENIKRDRLKKELLKNKDHVSGFPESNSSTESKLDEAVKQKDFEIFGKNEEAQGFQGYYSIPKATMNAPEPPNIALRSEWDNTAQTGGKEKEEEKNKEDTHLLPEFSMKILPTVVYHCFHNSPIGSFVFGGLYTDPNVDFQSLGISCDVEPENISVHFPCELPPHIDREIIMNPYMIMNPHFYRIKPQTGTITLLDSFTGSRLPKFCSMSSVKISKRQIFYYGGFSVENISSEYLPDSNRWIIEKRLVLNTDGYILDIFDLTFQKITLESSDGCVVRGRIGHAIAASSHDEWKDLLAMSGGDNDDAFSDRASGEGSNNSPIFNDGSSHHSSASNLNLNNVPSRSTPKAAPNFIKLPVSGSVTDSISSVTASAARTPSTYYEEKSTTSSFVEQPQPRKPHLHHIASESYTATKSEPPTPLSLPSNQSILTKTPSLSKYDTGSSSRSTNSSRSKNSAPAHSSPTLSKNIGSVLSMSSKLFHRNHQRSASSNPQQQTVHQQQQQHQQSQSQSQQQSQTVTSAHQSNMPPPNASNTNTSSSSNSSATQGSNFNLSSTYSNQVKQHRSNSNQSSGGSRPTSPIASPLSPNAHAKPFTSRLITETSQVQSSNPRKEYESNKVSPKANKKSSTKAEEYLTFSPVVGPVKHPAIKNIYDESESEKSYDFETISVFIFGGFVSDNLDSKYVSRFLATDDLFKVSLTVKRLYDDFVDFKDSAILYEMGKHAEEGNFVHGDLWPSPRGYFASAIINVNSTIADNCQINLFRSKSGQSDTAVYDYGDEGERFSIKPGRSSSSSSSSSSVSSLGGLETSASEPQKKTSITAGSKKVSRASESYFKGKALLIQGGCNEEYETFSDFYLYVFETGKWQTMSTYAYNYFDYPLQPHEDEDISKLTQENAKDESELVEAELRSCHHHALYYQNEGRDYLFFLGGLNNDYLRKFDNKDKPYESDKFDVSRLSRFQFASKNYFVSRIMVLNLQTQTWRFLRYYYNINHVMNEKFMDKILRNPSWINARICNLGGSFTIVGKTITIGHGLMIPVPEKKEDFEKLKGSYPTSNLLWGGYFSWTFPGL